MIKLNKDYKIQDVKKGITKNGKSYTIIKIRDSKLDESGKWHNSNFAIFALEDINAYENGNVKIGSIEAVDFKVRDYNGKTYADCTIYTNDVTTDCTNNEFTTSDPFGNDELPF